MKHKSMYFAAAVIIAGAIYKITLCPTVEFIDSGELALACKNLGIAHPTGYPLYTLLGRLASMFWGPLIINVNMMSLLFTALATGFLYLLILEAIGDEQNYPGQIVAASIALFTAFLPIWWAQGITNEVYSLNLMLIPCSLWLLFYGLRNRKIRHLLFSLYLLGLCLANHLSAVYIVPGYLYLLIDFYRKQRIEKIVILWMLAVFVFPISLYLFLPIRAAFKPFLNWGGVNDLYFLFKHISGWQYRVWMFDKPLAIFDFTGKVLPALKLILAQFGWPGVILLVIGIIAAVFKKRQLLLFIAITLLLNLVYVLNYDIGDIESYYLPLILVLSILIALGFHAILRKLIKNNLSGGTPSMKLEYLIVLLPILSLYSNFGVSDSSHKTFAKQGVIDIANSMNEGGIALVENWDIYSPWMYFHFEENYRPNVILLDKELMRRSWYIDFIRRKFPDIYERSKAEFEKFLHQVEPFERNRQFDPQKIDRAYYGMLNAVIRNEMPFHPVYTNILNDRNLIGEFSLIPDGVLFRIALSPIYITRPRFVLDEELWANKSINHNKRVSYLLSFYARAFEARFKYDKQFGHGEDSDYYANLRGSVNRIIYEIDNKR